jgi:flagellar hook-associated protein FlgK
MTFSMIVAFISSLPKMLDSINAIGDKIEKLSNEIREYRLAKEVEKIDQYKKEVAEVFNQIANAKTDAERAKLAREASIRMSK